MAFKTLLVALPSRVLATLWLLTSLVSAAQWTVTSYYAVSVTTSQYSTYTDAFDLYTWTDTITLKPSATITAEPVSTAVATDTYDDMKVVEIYYDPSDVDANDIQPTSSYDFGYGYSTYTYWYQEVVYTAPSSCPTAFTVTTYTDVNVPSAVTDQLSPKSKTTYITTYTDGDTYTYVTAYLSSGAVPTTTATTSDYIESYYIQSCRNPTATGEAYWGPGSTVDDDDDDDYYYGYCSFIAGCSSVKTWVIVVASVLPSLFVIGIFESFFWYRRLMLGKSALRFGTVCWCLISLWVICFTRRTPPRPVGDRPALRQQWNALSMGNRFRLWFKWGFRHAYPVDLLGPDPRGITPSTVTTVQTTAVPKPGEGQPSMMQMQPPFQGQPVYYYTGPSAPNGPQPVFNGQPPYGPAYMVPQPYMQPQYMMQPPGTTPSPLDTTTTPTPPPAVHTQNQDRTTSPGSDGSPVVPPQQPPQQPPQPPQDPPQQPPQQH